MAHYNLQDANDFIPCPYNKAEMITIRRMPQHLIKCPHKNEMDFETCPYNAIHIIPRADYRQHLTTCPARVVAEKTINYELEKQSDNFGRVKVKGCTEIPEYNTYDIHCSENWDDDDDEDVQCNVYQLVPSMVPDDLSEKSEMDSGIDVQDLSEVEFNDLEDRRSTRTLQGRDRHQNTPSRKPKQAPSVFQYSLRMAGVKQGHSLPGQATPQIFPDSDIDTTLASETFEDEIYDSKLLELRPKVKHETHDIRYETQDVRYETHDIRYETQDIRYETQDVRYETHDIRYETQDIRYKTQDVRPKVKHETHDIRYETQDVRPKVKHKTQDVRPKVKHDIRLNVKHETHEVRSKVKHETQDVRSRVKQVTQDVRTRVKQGLDKEASEHLRSNYSAISETNPNFKIEAPPDLRPKFSQNQSCDYNLDLNFPARDLNFPARDLNFPARDLSKKEISYGQNLSSAEVQPKMVSSQLSPGAGRGAILKYLISNNSLDHDPKPKALSPNGPLSPAPKGIGRGALAQYILGKIPADSSLHAMQSLNTERTSNVSSQRLGREMLVKMLKEKKVPANSESKVTSLAVAEDSSQRHNQGMLAQILKEKKVPENSERKLTPQVLRKEMHAQDRNEDKVPANSESKVRSPQVLGRGLLVQDRNEKKRSGNSEPKVTAPEAVLGRGLLAQDRNEKVPGNSKPKVAPTGGAPKVFDMVLNDTKVPANSESKVLVPEAATQVLGGGMLAQVLKDSKRSPESKVSRVQESDNEEDFIPEFKGIGRGARLKNGNQDPRLYPPSLGSSLSNKNFEYAKN